MDIEDGKKIWNGARKDTKLAYERIEESKQSTYSKLLWKK